MSYYLSSMLVLTLTLHACVENSISPQNKDYNPNNNSFTNQAEYSFPTLQDGSCSAYVNFDNLLVETTWDSNDINSRDVYSACAVDNQEWMDRFSDNRVRLKCLSLKKHRTELKEAQGDEKSLSEYKKMEYTAKFFNLPEAGVTIAQIHNRNPSVIRPYIRLFIDNDHRIKIRETLTGMTQETSVSYKTYTGMKYISGEDIQVTIWTGFQNTKELAQIRVAYKDQRFVTNLDLSNRPEWTPFSKDFYLKAGVYTGGNSKQATVLYSKFDIIH